MFFVSSNLSETFLATVMDHMYGKKCSAVFVCIHPATYKTLEEHTFKTAMPLVKPVMLNTRIWNMGHFTIQFLTSPEMREDTVLVFDDTQVTTITYN